jgi:hypothetical protein
MQKPIEGRLPLAVFQAKNMLKSGINFHTHRKRGLAKEFVELVLRFEFAENKLCVRKRGQA